MYECACESGRNIDIHRKTERNSLFLMVELQLRFSQGHPLTYDIHGARLSLSLGRSPSAPTDKTGYFMSSRQTLQLGIVYYIQR